VIVRQYVEGVEIEGLGVSTDGLRLTIQPGSLELPSGKVTLTEPVVLEFAPADVVSDVQIGFDGLGRLYVDRHGRGQPPEEQKRPRFGIFSHYVYFALPLDATDLANVAINVLCEPRQKRANV
jgi:hypothetical protein